MLLIVEFRVPDWAKKFISVESKVEYIALGGCAFEYLSKRPKEPVVEESYSVIDLVVWFLHVEFVELSMSVQSDFCIMDWLHMRI